MAKKDDEAPEQIELVPFSKKELDELMEQLPVEVATLDALTAKHTAQRRQMRSAHHKQSDKVSNIAKQIRQQGR